MSASARLARALNVRPAETRVVVRVLVLMVVAWAGFAVGANGIESLFFTRFGPEFLPWMYVALGVVTVPVTLGVGAVLGRGDRRRALVGLAPVMAAVAIALRGLAMTPRSWIYPAMWLGMMVLWIVQGIGLWSVAGVVHDARQAKRLFPLYGAGVIFGGAVGGLATPVLARNIGAENLILVWGATLLAMWPLSALVLGAGRRHRRPAIGRRPRPPRVLDEMRQGYRTARSSALLRWMSLAAVLLGFLYFVLTLPFAEAVTARYPDADRLASFLGAFSGTANALALLVSLAVANRMFARFGVPAMVLVMPFVYLLGFGVVAAVASFTTLVAFRFVQLVWVHGVYTTGWQALFGVVAPERRAQARAFVEGGPMQVGIVLAGAVLLFAQRFVAERTLFVVAAVVALAAVLACWAVRRAYADAVAAALRAGWPEVFTPGESFAGVRWDAATFEALRAGAADPDPSVRRLAMEIAADVPLVRARALCVGALRDPDPDVRAAALRGVAASALSSAVDDVAALLEDPDSRVRLAAIDALVSCAADDVATRRLEPLLRDGDARVRARAATPLARTHATASRVLEALARDADGERRAVAIEALTDARVAPEIVSAALRDPDPRVRVAAVRGVAALDGRPNGALLDALGDEEASVRAAATEALVVAGEDAVPALLVALDDARRDEAAIEVLARLRAVEPARLRAYARRHVGRALEYHRLWSAIGADGEPADRLLAAALRERALAHARRALHATSPFGDRTAIALATEALSSRDANQRANAVEMLEATGDRAFVRPLLEVWDPVARRGDRAAAVRAAMADDDAWVRACAVMAAARDGALADALGAARSDADPLVRETATAIAEGGGRDVETLSTLSVMERVLALREVPLFRELRSSDLKRVADAAAEHVYPDGTLIAERGDPGDAMHVVVSGDVRVLVEEGARVVEVARRGPGYIVGEMAVLTEEPRMASLVASGDVRTLSIDRARFQRILRERPDAAVAVMRELCARLRDVHEHREFEVSR